MRHPADNDFTSMDDVKQPDICQCLVVQTMACQKYQSRTSMIHVTCKSKLRSVLGNPCINALKTGLQSGMRLCIMAGLPTHLVQELNVCTVHIRLCQSVISNGFHFIPSSASRHRIGVNCSSKPDC